VVAPLLAAGLPLDVAAIEALLAAGPG
jgi:hypothetical protein